MGLWFRLPPERAHATALGLLQAAGATAAGRALLRARYGPPLGLEPVSVFGLRFPNRLGLAAGWDKDARGLLGLSAFAFGHVEVGTVTPRPQPGNPRPRVFRLEADRALINRMGFPGEGMDAVARRLAAFRKALPDPARRPVVGVNLGRNKDTPNDRAHEDYAALITRFAPLADYLVLNVSSPNTSGLRDLQARAALDAMLGAAMAARAEAPARTPLLLKLSPDLSPAALEDAVGVALERGIDGLIVTNTTLSRPDLKAPSASEAGGLSGAPLGPLADRVLADTVRLVAGKVPVIAAGGVMTSDDFRRKLDLGAALVQVWTGLIYGGPGWPRELLAGR